MSSPMNWVGFGEISRWLVSENQKAKKKGRMMKVAIRAKPGSANPHPARLDVVSFEAIGTPGNEGKGPAPEARTPAEDYLKP